MSRARAASISRSARVSLRLGVAFGVAVLWAQTGQAQQSSDLRGTFADADTAALVNPLDPQVSDPLRPPAPAEPLYPLQKAPLSGQGLLAQPAPTPTRQLQAEDIDDHLDGAPDEINGGPSGTQNPRNPTQLPENLAAPPANDAAQSEQPGEPTVTGKNRKQATTGPAILTTGTVRAKSIDAADLARNTAARPESERALAIEAIDRRPDANPFDPPGIRAGTFILRPTLEQGIEWTSNVTNTAGGASDFVSESTLKLDAASDWARHSASFSGYGTYRTSVSGSGYSEFFGAGDAALNLELGNEFTLHSTLGYERRLEDATSPVDIVGAVSKPLRQTLSGSLGLEKTVGKLQFGATGSVDRDVYGDAVLDTGATLSQADRNETLYALALRGGYEISPALTPFIEAQFGRRLYDNTIDASGYRRSATRYGALGGLSFDHGEKLKGEIAAGWISEKPDDERLGPVSGFSAEGNVDWSPIRGTTVSLTGATEVEGSTTPGESGSIRYSATLGVSRELRANLTGTAALGVDWRRYAGTPNQDFTWSAETSLTWWFNRYAGLKARARHEDTSSTIAGRSSQTTSVFLGVTLRR